MGRSCSDTNPCSRCFRAAIEVAATEKPEGDTELYVFATALLEAVSEQDAAVADLLRSNLSLRTQVLSLTAQLSSLRRTLDDTQLPAASPCS